MNESQRDQQQDPIKDKGITTASADASMPDPLLVGGIPDFSATFTFKAGGRTWGLCWDCRQKIQFSGDHLQRHVKNRPDHVKRKLLPQGEKALRDIYENLDAHLSDPSVVLLKKKGINIRNSGRHAKDKESQKLRTERGRAAQTPGSLPQRPAETQRGEESRNNEAR